MKVILIGASGTLGNAVYTALAGRHEVVTASRSSGDFRVDISDKASISALYQQVGAFDALVNCCGKVAFAPLEAMSGEQFQLGLANKLMGQVQLVKLGLATIRSGGSFTLTSGLLNDEPILGGSSAAMVNGALEGFVRAAALELLAKGLRINLVSPTVIEESLAHYGAFFPGYQALPAAQAALGYLRSVEGAQSGRTFRLGWSRD